MEQTEKNESRQSQDTLDFPHDGRQSHPRKEDDRMLTVDDILKFYADSPNFRASGQE